MFWICSWASIYYWPGKDVKQCTLYELWIENPLKILVKGFFCWFGLFCVFLGLFGVCVFFFFSDFWFWVWESDHSFQSQRNQENDKTVKIFVYHWRTVLGEEVDDESSVSPVKLCSFGSGVHACARVSLQHQRASVSIHSFPGRRPRPSERK